MLNTKFSPWPSYTEEESNAVSRVLLSNKVNYWTGEECKKFESEFATWVGTRHAVSLANGTLAMDIAWQALGIGDGDEVICTPRTFQASGSSIVLAGATPIFADVDPDTQNITPATVAPLITAKTRAILCVHIAGWPCDMEGFADLVQGRQIHLVEDCAQAHGATIGGRSVGTFSAVAAWSFCQDKIITTGGEGGMVTLDDTELWSKIWAYKDHGKSYDAVFNRKHAPGFRWVHEGWGTNWRLTEMQSAVGRIQLTRMADWHAARKQNAYALMGAFDDLAALRVPQVPANIEHAWYRLYAFVRPEALKGDWSRDRIMETVVERGVPCYAGICPEIYREKSFTDAGLAPLQRLPQAAVLGDTSLMFLVHPTLTKAEIGKTCETVRDVMREATR